MSCLIDTPVVI